MPESPDLTSTDPVSPPDDELVALAATGGRPGRRAFDALVERHMAWLVRTVDYLLGNRSDAEDVAQDAFVRAYAAIARCPTDGFRPWLRVIATRLAYNHRRASGTRQSYHDRFRDVAQRGRSLVDQFDEDDLIEAALGSISYPYREILILRHVEEMSVAEISDALGIGVSAAKMRLLRARQEFRVAYDRHRAVPRRPSPRGRLRRPRLRSWPRRPHPRPPRPRPRRRRPPPRPRSLPRPSRPRPRRRAWSRRMRSR